MLALALVKLCSTLQRQIDGFGCATRPDNFARIGTYQIRHLRARNLDGFFSFPAPCMASGSRIAKMLAQPRNHGIHHARIHRCSSCVIEINREMRCHVHGWLNENFWLALKMVKGACLMACLSAAAGMHDCAASRFQDLANTLPSANTELGAFTRIGLMTGAVEMALRTAGLSSI